MTTLYGFIWNLTVAFATIGVGYWLALKPKKWLTAQKIGYFMSVGTGILISTVFVELLPHALHISENNYTKVFLTALFGVITVLIFERTIAPYFNFELETHDHAHDDDGCAHHHEYKHDHGHHHANITGPEADHMHAACGHALIGHTAACSAVGCLIVCSFFDGIAFSASGFGGSGINKVILMGQLFHVIPEGLLASGLIIASDGKAKSAKLAAMLTGGVFMVGAMIPSATSLLFENIEKAEGFFLSFASGILLYVTIGQLLPVINQGKVGRILFIGSILFTVIVFSLTGHHH